MMCYFFFFFKQKTAYELRISDWSSDVCSSDLFQKFTLRRRLKRIEQALEKQILTPRDRADGITIEFNLEGLLRADSSARADFYREMASIGAMTINEVRALENLLPVPGGDQPRMQMQNEIGRAACRERGG